MFKDPSFFSRPESFLWFTVAVLGIMVRSDGYGIASCIRSVGIDGQHYGAFDNFFHSLSWNLSSIRTRWHDVVNEYAPLKTCADRISLLIDHTKKPKEGRRMPGVQKLCQESETQSKPEYIHGHMFGGLSVIAYRRGTDALVAIPLILQLQSGISHLRNWLDMSTDKLGDEEEKAVKRMKRAVKDLEISIESSITQMIVHACHSAQLLKHDANIIADRAFLTLKALHAIDESNLENEYKVYLVTRCKKNLAVYSKPLPRPEGKRGRASKKGKRLYFGNLFALTDDELRNTVDPNDTSIRWVKKSISMYGKEEDVTFAVLNLVWSKAHCRVLRFVLVKYNDVESILVTTDLSMDPETVIQLYCTREKIETTFRELNQIVHAFSARFWTKAMPKLNHFRKSSDPDPLEEVTSASDREKVALTARAIDLYAALSCIAIGLIQIISIVFPWSIQDFAWQRTPVDQDRPSEECIQKYLRDRISEKIFKNSDNEIGALLRDSLDEKTFDEVEKLMIAA